MWSTYSIAALFAVCLTQILAEGTTRDDDLIEAYVLPNTTFPTFYDVQLYIDPDFTGYFLGNVTIRIIPNVATDEIVLHAMQTDILSVTVFSELNTALDLFDSYTLATDDTHLLRIKLTRNMVIWQPHTININYVARFADNMFGVYFSTYTESNGNRVSLVTSQLQPTFARRAFPCYDEPYYKAVFRTTIYAPSDFPIVRSNMPLRTDLLKPDQPGYVKHEFEDTLIMSSYLNAYLISEFNYVENAGNLLYRIPFKVYSRPGTQAFAEFALEFGQRNMVALEEYTDFPYYFPKLDKVAVPDFAAGAMENWGLIIYREAALLVQTGVTTTSSRQGVGRIICHENLHQWFGNEVSPVSWTYTWLNEGFANFFESYATDLVLPEWRMMDQFVINLQNVFQSDAVLTVNSMTHGVFTPSQILATFNSVAYQKSGSVIRMMQHALTPEVFRRGLRIYLQKHTRRAVVPSDLYEALQEALDESNHSFPLSVASVMDTWATQGGFPVITITRTSPSADSLMAQQERYLTDRTLSSSSLWPVPLNWVLSTNPEFSSTSPDAWMSAQTMALDIPALSSADWYIFNKQQTGYYRINYDEQNWQALVSVMQSSPSVIPVLNRAQLVDDSFNLARNGRLNYEYPLELSRYLSEELDYIPWASANAAFTYLNTVLSGSSVYELFQQYILELTLPLYQRLGFIASPTEEHVTAFHRTIVLNLNCRFGNADCVNTASQLLENLRNNAAETLNPDIQTSVFCSGLRGGDVENFNFLWSRYVASTDSSEQSILLNALGCTTNAQTRDFYLNQVISPESAVREQDRNTVLVAVINSSPDNMEVAFDFIIENFSVIQGSVQSLTGTTSVLNALANVLTTEEHRNKIENFSTRYEGSFSAGELASLNLIRENIAATITWNSQNFGIVENWLNVNIGGVTPEPTPDTPDSTPDTPELTTAPVPVDEDSSASAVTASCLVLLSVALLLRQNL